MSEMKKKNSFQHCLIHFSSSLLWEFFPFLGMNDFMDCKTTLENDKMEFFCLGKRHNDMT